MGQQPRLHKPNNLEEVTLKEEIEMDNKQRLAYAIVKYLKDESSTGKYSEDVTESLEGIKLCMKVNAVSGLS